MSTLFDDLDIKNNFLFQQVMKNPHICKRLLEELLQIKIEKLTYHHAEETIQTGLDSRGIRLDIVVADENHTHYDLEMQVENRKSKETGVPLLFKRTRYYQSALDMDLLGKGQDFDKLSNTFIIFICAFDLFGEGRYCYTFKQSCVENPGLVLNNGATVMFVNTLGYKGEASAITKSFLQYVNNKAITDDFTKEIDAEIRLLKRSSEIRRQYMLLALELHDARMDAREEGLAEGRAEGRAEGEVKKLVLLIERRMHKTGMSCEDVMEDLDCTPEERSQYYAYLASNKE